MESSRTLRARMFIDATYEGDLMAAAGGSFIIGREANSHYGETVNGLRPAHPIGLVVRQGTASAVLPTTRNFVSELRSHITSRLQLPVLVLKLRYNMHSVVGPLAPAVCRAYGFVPTERLAIVPMVKRLGPLATQHQDQNNKTKTPQPL